MANIKSATLTTTDNKEVKTIGFNKQLIVFLIGGAGDKRAYLGTGPNKNIVTVQGMIDHKYKKQETNNTIKTIYLGYYEVFGEDRIWEVLKKANLFTEYQGEIILSSNPIVIIGHSLGGWNGAHFTENLEKWKNIQKNRKIHAHSPKNFMVKMLITLDPVGEGITVGTFSDIYFTTPKVSLKNWINLKYDQDWYSFPDFVADLGGQWDVKSGPRVNEVVGVDHAFTKAAMLHPIKTPYGNTFNELCVEIDDFIKNC